ncbi:MAG: hypothetical protein IT462_15430 [Planctomycetes bacterium]|nr:hypothetical protein [Planctomycetota bacterium]
MEDKQGKKQKKRRLGAKFLSWAPTRIGTELFMRWMAFWFLIFGHRWTYFWARRVAWFGWYFGGRIKGVTLRNLELCFPEKSEAERTRIGKASVRHFCYYFADILLLPKHFKGERWKRYFTTLPAEHPCFQVARGDKPGFYVGVHFGNWEVMSCGLFQACGVRTFVIMKPLNPPLLNRWIIRLRTALGSEVVMNEGGGGRGFARAIKENRKLGVLVDQNGGDHAPVETFLGVPCTWQADFARLAVRAGTVIHTAAYRDGERFKFVLADSPVIKYTRDSDPMQVVRDYRDYIEKTVRERPEQYFWMHRRFKGRKPGWPDRYANLGRRLTPEERQAILSSPAPVAA